MINLIGDHAVTHRQYDAPLASDIAALAAPNSRWLKSVDRVEDAGALAVEAFEASYGPPPGPVSLIMPADVAWTQGAMRAAGGARASLKTADDDLIEAAGRAVAKAKRPAACGRGRDAAADGGAGRSRDH
jgi:acetolactate synthase-1/2/3 large subunit